MADTSRPASKKLIPILLLLWVVTFGFGFIGHLQHGESILGSFYKTLKLFHLYYKPGEIVDQAGDPLLLLVAQFCGALWNVTFLPVMIGIVFEERIYRWWVNGFWKQHYVVCGGSSRSLELVRDLRRQGRKVVFVSHTSDEKDAMPFGVLFLEGDSGDPEVLRKSAVHRAAYLIALHEEDLANIETLVAAGKLCDRRSEKQPPLYALAHIADARLESILRQLCDSSVGLAGAKVREHFFNYYELMARLLVRRVPLPPTLAESRPQSDHIVIVGFAAFGQCAALKLIQMAQQLYRGRIDGEMRWRVAKPRITVMDPLAESLLAEFERMNPRFREFCDLDYRSTATTDARFPEQEFLVRKDPGVRRSVVFCLETEAMVLRAISPLCDLSRSESGAVDRIFLRIAQPERLGSVLEKLQPEGGKPEIVFFAPDSEVFSADVLLCEKLDLLAREIHNAYLGVEADDRRSNNLPPAAGKSWNELSQNDRQSNREVADHLCAKLHMLGYDLYEVPGHLPEPTTNLQLLRELKEREEELAYAEHYRWMTWRILDGWQYGEKRDPVKKQHPDIKEYDLLHESTKEKDRANIRIIAKLLSEGRLKAVRRTSWFA